MLKATIISKLQVLLLLFYLINASSQVLDENFENWSSAVPFGITDSGIDVAQENEITYKGKSAAKITVNTGNQANTDWQKQIQLTAGVSYTISFRVYHTEGNMKARIIFGGYRNYSKKELTNQWQEITTTYTPSQTSNYNVGLRFYDQPGFTTSEIVYVDDFIIKKTPIKWAGTTDNDWNNTSNWQNGVIPSTTDNVIIPEDATNFPTVQNSLTVNSIEIENGASLIANATINADVIQKRKLTNNWHIVASPLANMTSQDVIYHNKLAEGTNGNLGFAPYNNTLASSKWQYIKDNNTDNTILAKGYATKTSATRDFEFSGTIHGSDQSINISQGNNKYYLIGNPFSASVVGNLSANNNNFLTNNSANLEEETLWVWNHTTNSYEPINQSSDPYNIAVGQGFFVKSKPTGGTVNFSKALQTHQTGIFYRKPTSKITLKINQNNTYRKTEVRYIKGTTAGFDNGYDSSFFEDNRSNLAIFTQLIEGNTNQRLSIQSLPDTSENTIIPIGIKGDLNKEITIHGTTNNINGKHIFLEDKNTGVLTNLSENSYTTTINSSTSIGRFYLHLKLSTLGVTDFNSTKDVQTYVTEKNLYIKGLTSSNSIIKIYSILGKKVFEKHVKITNNTKINLNNLRTGIYVVKINSKQEEVTRKILLR